MVREGIGGIVSSGHHPPVPAAVRFQASPEELGGVPLDDLALPRRQDDGPQMFPAATVLGKEEGPGPRVTGHRDAGTVVANAAYAIVREQCLDRFDYSIGDRSLLLME